MGKTKIEWTNYTVNPWWGCVKISPACANCYAEGVARRFSGGLWGRDAARRLRVAEALRELDNIAALGDREGRPQRVFIASMSDFFEDRPDLIDPRKRIWDKLHQLGTRITPLLLTKRPEIAAVWAEQYGWPAGAWAGTTVENQGIANVRIPELLKIPARVRFLSMEPLLGPVNLRSVPWERGTLDVLDGICVGAGGGYWSDCPTVQWVIVGGESGPRARPMAGEWAREIKAACLRTNVPYFFKQWGAWVPEDQAAYLPREIRDTATRSQEIEGERVFLYGKEDAGRVLDGRTWDAVPWVGTL